MHNRRAVSTLLVSVVLFISPRLVGHDPGFSTLTIEDGATLRARLTLAPDDVLALGGFPALRAGALEFVVDGRTAEPTRGAARRDADNVEIGFELARPIRELELHARFIEALPRGHRLYVELVGAGGERVRDALLDARSASFVAPFEPHGVAATDTLATWARVALAALALAGAGLYAGRRRTARTPG